MNKIRPILICFVLLLIVSCTKIEPIKLKIDSITYNFNYLEKDKYLLDSEVTNNQYYQYLIENNLNKNDANKINKYSKQNFKMDYICRNIFNIWVDEKTLENKYIKEKGDLPVTFISQDEARKFVEWFNKKFSKTYNFRLPTIEEMYYSSYNNGDRNFPWGNSFGIDYFANKISSKRYNGDGENYFQEFSKSLGRNLEPVYQRKGKNPNGIYGIWGNASEWLFTEGDYLESDIYSDRFTPKLNLTCDNYTIKGSDSIGFRMLLIIRH